jgi:hypothetical protein
MAVVPRARYLMRQQYSVFPSGHNQTELVHNFLACHTLDSREILTMTQSNLEVRLRIKEALARVEDARIAAVDSWTCSRLQNIARDLAETLTYLVPDRIGPCPRRVAAVRQSR